MTPDQRPGTARVLPGPHELLRVRAADLRKLVASWADAWGLDGVAETAADDLARALRDLNSREATAPGTVALSDVTPETVRWLWPGRIPLGRLTLIDGDPGLGKSTLSLDLAARVSTGARMPDGSPGLGEPAGVVLLTAEDGLADTVRPRLDAAGGNPTRVSALRWVHTRDLDDGTPGKRLPTVQDLGVIAVTVRQVEAQLLIVDPLSAYLGPNVNAHRDADVRAGLAGLAELAERLGVAVVAIRHLTKAKGANPLYAGGGSIALIAAARSALLLAPDPDDEGRLVLASLKNNLAPKPGSLALRVAPAENGSTRIRWEGESAHGASDLLRAASEGDEERTALEDAKAFLQEELRKDPVPAKEIQARAKDAGHAVRTVQRAAEVLGVEKLKDGYQGAWRWKMPRNADLAPLDPEHPENPYGTTAPPKAPRAGAFVPKAPRVGALGKGQAGEGVSPPPTTKAPRARVVRGTPAGTAPGAGPPSARPWTSAPSADTKANPSARTWIMPEGSYDTREARSARSAKVCRLLSERIGQVTSPGLGRWDLAWEIVRAPSSRFLEALAEWERTAREEDMDRAKGLALEVLDAWKEAERRYRELGRPHTPDALATLEKAKP